MACATLKRSLEWDIITERPTKRRRCNPFDQSSVSPGRASFRSQASMYHRMYNDFGRYVEEPHQTSFLDAKTTKISQDTMAQSIRDEIKRLHKKKQLTSLSAVLERMQDSESSGSEMGLESPRRPDSPTNIVRNPEKALFTFTQVKKLCQRMVAEREEVIRKEYEEMLNAKLAEQYDVFVRFTQDQIERRYESAPSYLS